MYKGEKMHLDPALPELGQTRAGWLNVCQFVYSQHCKMSRMVGPKRRTPSSEMASLRLF
jgi:alkylhydroperoxidase family enzyme